MSSKNIRIFKNNENSENFPMKVMKLINDIISENDVVSAKALKIFFPHPILLVKEPPSPRRLFVLKMKESFMAASTILNTFTSIINVCSRWLLLSYN